jgi:hypothetical protein
MSELQTVVGGGGGRGRRQRARAGGAGAVRARPPPQQRRCRPVLASGRRLPGRLPPRHSARAYLGDLRAWHPGAHQRAFTRSPRDAITSTPGCAISALPSNPPPAGRPRRRRSPDASPCLSRFYDYV